jgi:hypothetical protein
VGAVDPGLGQSREEFGGSTGGGVCGAVVAGAGVLAFGFGSVFVGAGLTVGFAQFARFMCVSPGAGCLHCGFSVLFFGFTVVGEVGFVVVGLVCATPESGIRKSVPAATPASKIGYLTRLLPNDLGNNAMEAFLVPPRGTFYSAILRLRRP